MPQCKKDGCKTEAVPFGKRYCPSHLAEYKAKQAAYAALRATLPACPQCGDKLSKTRADAGETLCGSCAATNAERQRERDMQEQLDWELDRCETVEDLKAFIRERLMP